MAVGGLSLMKVNGEPLGGFAGVHVWPTAGVVRILGHTLGNVNVRDLRRHIGLVGPSGSFLGQPSTLMRHGEILWQSHLWTTDSVNVWLAGGAYNPFIYYRF